MTADREPDETAVRNLWELLQSAQEDLAAAAEAVADAARDAARVVDVLTGIEDTTSGPPDVLAAAVLRMHEQSHGGPARYCIEPCRLAHDARP